MRQARGTTKNKKAGKNMEDRILKKLTDMTDNIYTSIMGQVRNGYFAIWNPRFQELHKVMEELLSAYGRYTKGLTLQKQFELFQSCEQDCTLLEEVVFSYGDLGKMEQIQKKLTQSFQEVYEDLQVAILCYESIEEKIQEVVVLEGEYEELTQPLVEDYKLKIQNRIQQNIAKVQQFDQFSREEKADFITHVILFDEGKLENQLLGYLDENERKLEDAFVNLEYTVVISKKDMTEEACREYIEKYRLKTQKKNPKEFSTSRQLMDESELGDKFETWFNSLIGKESSVGKLIKEDNKVFDLPIEERMFEAIEGVIDSNLGVLNMKDIVAAYKEECMDLKEQFFHEFYGEYKEVQNLIKIVEKANQVFSKWSIRDVSIADIILGDY